MFIIQFELDTGEWISKLRIATTMLVIISRVITRAVPNRSPQPELQVHVTKPEIENKESKVLDIIK
jgi:hypothetical protein